MSVYLLAAESNILVLWSFHSPKEHAECCFVHTTVSSSQAAQAADEESCDQLLVDAAGSLELTGEVQMCHWKDLTW